MEIASALNWICVLCASLYCGLADAFWLGSTYRERISRIEDGCRFAALLPAALMAQE